MTPYPLRATQAPMNGAARRRRFLRAAQMVGRIYAGYKGIQLIGRLAGDRWADDLFRRQHRRSAELIYRTATDLKGLLIKSCQFIGTRADILPDEYVDV